MIRIETNRSLRPQQHRRGAAVTGEVANPTVPSESHGLRRRVFGRDGETGGRQRLPQIGRNLRGRWRGEHHRHVIRLVHFRCDDGRPRNRELLDRPIEVAECGKRDTVGRDRGLRSRMCGRWRWTEIARGASPATHEETPKKSCGRCESPAVAYRSCSRNADARSSRVPPHALQSSVRPGVDCTRTDSPPVSPPSSPANMTEPSRDARPRAPAVGEAGCPS
jgi:hypothetical protein